MKEVFCDSLYFKALADRRDQYHNLSVKLADQLGAVTLVTTHEVFLESLNFLSGYGPNLRQGITKVLESFCAQPHCLLLGLSQERFVEGWQLYRDRSDKDYSLTDCISMVVMRKRGIADVLTHDSHFRQEGFNLLLNSKGGK